MKFQGIIFGYKINSFSYYENLVYATTLIKSQQLIRWQLILEEFGTNIQHIARVDKILYDRLIIFLSTSFKKYKHTKMKSQCCTDELFSMITYENNEDCFLLDLFNVQIEHQK